MSKGNPIVGLAYVVTSQQEMLEEANKKNDELTKEYMELLKEKEQLEYTTFNCERGDIPMHEVEEVFRTYEGRIKELVEQCNEIKSESDAKIQELEAANNMLDDGLEKAMADLQNAKDQEKYFADEYNRVNHINLDLHKKVQMYEQGKLIHWQKFVPDESGRMFIPLEWRHALPAFDGIYRYTEEHTPYFYDEVTHEKTLIKNCYGYGYIASTIIDGKLYIYPNGEKGSELIGFAVHYIDDYVIMDELPEELK